MNTNDFQPEADFPEPSDPAAAATEATDAPPPPSDPAPGAEAPSPAPASPDAAAASPDADASDDAPAESPDPVSLLQNRLLRLQADFDNFRKRTVREKQDWIALAGKDILSDLLPVLDNFERGLSAAADTPPAVLDGFSQIHAQLLAVLKKAGAEPIETDGLPFDPSLHEAISRLPSPTLPEGAILACTRRGWLLGGKLLRPAQVVVSAGPADS